MENTGCHQIPMDKILPGVSSLGSDVTLMRFQNHSGLNGGSNDSPKMPKLPHPALNRPTTGPARPRPRNAVSEGNFNKKPDRKRPTTGTERLRWLNNIKKNKFSKSPDGLSFKNTVGKRKVLLQHPKMYSNTMPNGNHDLIIKSNINMNEIKEFTSLFPKATDLPPSKTKNSLLMNRSKPELPSGTSVMECSVQHNNSPSTVTFKCRKCSCTSFESLDMLKEHQLNCSSQVSADPVPETDSSVAGPGGSASGNRTARQVVLCSACGIYFENWNIFLHMRSVHGRHICLFCLGLFSHAEKLIAHLMGKHNIQINNFSSKEEITEKLTDAFYLLCCKCEVIFTQEDNFATHECTQVIRLCTACNTKGGHKADCPKNSKHKYGGHLDLDSAKKNKKNVPTNNNKPIFDPLCVLPMMSVGVGVEDKVPFPNYDIKVEKDITDLTLLEGIGVSDLNALSYAVPDVKPEKISPSSMALLIEEVKNCLSTPQPPQPTPVEVEATKLPAENDIVSISNDVPKNLEPPLLPPPPTPSITITESHFTSPSDDKININTSFSKTSTENPVSVKPNVIPQKEPSSEPITPEKEVNRVPKLTVKVPKVITEKENSEYSSESEDSDKLTVDLEAKGENTYVNNVDVKEPVESPDVKKIEHIHEDETPGEDIPVIELTLDQPLDKYPLKDLLQVLLNASIYSCIYCNHARRIAVNGKQLGLHFISQHKFTATVNSITAEELLPETIVSKIRICLTDVEDVYVNLDNFAGKTDLKLYNKNYECFQCYYVTAMHKDLYFHNRKMHQKTILLCVMCKSNFYTYSELLCHMCPGTYLLDCEVLFRCCVCELEPISSAFRLMVHLRKRHHACDVCLETCYSQSKLSSHVCKHKLHHLCYRCGIAYRNKPDITKHLFWKHGTESVLCKKCLQRKWPHVYHFCVPPLLFTCEECSLNFTKAVYLKVHKRIHANEYPYDCKEPNCTDKFISRKLLAKHVITHTIEVEKEKSLSNVDKSLSIKNDEIIDLCDTKSEVKIISDTKSKKSKRNKLFKDNLLIDVNLPALNLSESGSSDDSDTEVNKKSELSENIAVNPADENTTKLEATDESKPEPVQGIWDNFKLYQESLEKQVEKPHVPTHVCESDHDYCLITSNESPDVEIIGEIKMKIDPRPIEIKDSPKKKNKNGKKKNKSDTISSSSDSSSDSDSSCSCGTNCSCSSSSGSSSSSSSSDSSSITSQKKRNNQRKDSDASHNSAVDIMATEGSPAHPAPKPKELSFAESDLDSDESATDEDFYDKNPQRIANKLLAEKRNLLIQSASTSPTNNGTYHEASRPPTPGGSDKTSRKKIKVKKRKKEKRSELESHKTIAEDTHIPALEQQPTVSNKITISLQSNTVQIQESVNVGEIIKNSSGTLSDADSKRASKRRRVPNKFYGYSSDEEFLLKSHQPPKLEWRKEDLPSPSIVIQQQQQQIIPLEVPRVPEIPIHIPEPVVPIKSPLKESSSDDSDSSKEGVLQIKDPYSPSERTPEPISKPSENIINPPLDIDVPFPRPAGAREAREGESVYCYCRCPYDEVSEMIACDAKGCSIEWFHFECVGIMVPPKGQWFCPDCRVRQDNLNK